MANDSCRVRAQFEAWISVEPYCGTVDRFGAHSSWAGSYKDISVSLAWDAWQESRRLERERIVKMLEALPRKDVWDIEDIKQCTQESETGRWVEWADIETMIDELKG